MIREPRVTVELDRSDWAFTREEIGRYRATVSPNPPVRGTPADTLLEALQRPWWQSAASCRGQGTDVFFDPQRTDEAAAVCAGCPVREECREAGAGEHGWWGDTPRPAAELIDGPKLATVKRHGTSSSYVMGCRCGECRTARRDYARALRARRKAA